MDRLQEEAANLRHLSTVKPKPERFQLVRSALGSKWEGIQSAALHVLSVWGGRDAVRIARSFLEDAFERKHGWSIRGVAIGTLSKIVTADDVEWVLDLYFSRPTVLDKHELLPLVIKLPVTQARGRLVNELSSKEAMNRHAAVKAIGNMPFEDKKLLLNPMRKDSAKGVRDAAKALTRSWNLFGRS